MNYLEVYQYYIMLDMLQKKVTLSDPYMLSNQGSASENSSETMWMLLQKAKRDESIAK